MRRLLVLVTLVTLVACVPKLDPVLPPAAGATLTAFDVTAGTLYRVDVSTPIDRLALLFTGDDLSVNAAECEATATDVACIVRDVRVFYEVTVAGEVTRAEGIVQRGRAYGLLLVTP